MPPTPTSGRPVDAAIGDAPTAAVTDAAARLRSAALNRRPCAPVRDLLGVTDVDAAYAVQSLLAGEAQLAGRRLVGRKIGLTSPAVQAQFGVHQPDFGALFKDMQVPVGDSVDLSTLISPRIEAEVVFCLASDLDGTDISVDDVAAATAWVAPAIEIVDSRINGWDITITDTVADNASSGLFLVGSPQHHLTDVNLVDLAMTITSANGDQVVSSGTGAACLGSPLVATTWLARELQQRGTPLRSGDLVLSGALGPMVSVSHPDVFTADFPGFGTLRLAFEGTPQQ